MMDSKAKSGEVVSAIDVRAADEMDANHDLTKDTTPIDKSKITPTEGEKVHIVDDAIKPLSELVPEHKEKEDKENQKVPGSTKEREVETGGKQGHGSILPGWTIMRPLKMRALDRKTKGAETITTEAAIQRDDSYSELADSKDSEGLKIMNTEQTGRSDPRGEVDCFSDLRSDDELLEEEDNGVRAGGLGRDGTADGVAVGGSTVEYKVYKRRWFGLVQLVLLNIVVSWDWLTFAASSGTAAEYYNVTESRINWLSTGFQFSFIIAAPFVILTLHRGGPTPSIIASSVLLLLGNWIRYGATRSGKHGNFGGLMFGQILTGLAQPFVLAAPTRYSDMWFTNRGRVAATAATTLANPLGGALAQLVGPFWADKPSDIPNLVLYVSIIASVASIPSFFIPHHPPTLVSHSGATAKQPLLPSLKFLFTSREFYQISITFTIFVGLFNSCSSLINQMLEPYSFSEDEAGIGGALLIVVGLVTSAVTSPIIDKTKGYLLAIKAQVPIVALAYLAFTWAPQTRSLAAPYAILAILGAASFSLVPVVLEYIIELTHPVSPEVTSTIMWTGGQLLGGIFILISDALKAPKSAEDVDDGGNRPPGNLYRALVFQTVVACFAVPWPMMLGLFGRSHGVKMRRVEADREAEARRRGEAERGNA
ncbi:major facilitator superfamily domain-containing protein [Amylocarpus encephaloides]|uniref:Major facilitator superfamily domain-containing protein n=1 Tax=Amylocarpus encephaloides TaxID=45428 RepID=A0A9P8C719_9HELO|nr:major facilitator superfamily domain-containing protein [Amylocarpus encephaloides]